jgi:3-oxoacyl-[acyl-carrier-protein] synthase II
MAMSARRVVITGLGTVNALGCDMDSSWESLLNGKMVFDETHENPWAKVIAPVNGFDEASFKKRMGKSKCLSLAYGLQACDEAMEDASMPHELKEKIGLVWGNGMPAVPDVLKCVEKTEKANSCRNADRTLIFRSLRNLVGCAISIDLGLKSTFQYFSSGDVTAI